MPLSSSPAWSRPSPVAGPAPTRHGAQNSTTPEGREPNGSPRFIRRELTEGAVALFRVRLVLAAIAVVVPACSSSDQQASPSSGASRASSRSDAAPASGLTGEIAIGAGDGHLWLINAKTGARLQLTHGQNGTDFDPRWSPDGRQIVFRSTRSHVPDPQGIGLDGILIVNRDGSNERLISGSRGGLAAAWSPDGRTIVYSTSFDEVNERLASFDLASGKTRDLGVYGEGVDWSPDGHVVLVGRLQSIVDAQAASPGGAPD